GEAEVLARLGLADVRAGRIREAVRHFETALELARTLEAVLVETNVRNGLGEALLAAGQPRQAAAHHAAALALAERTGDRDEQARAQRALAETHAVLGDADRAHRHLREARTLYAALGVPEAEQIRAAPAAAVVPGARPGRERGRDA